MAQVGGNVSFPVSVAEGNEQSAALDNGQKLMGVINALASDVADLYEMDLATREITVYRFTGNATGVREGLKQPAPYEAAMEAYICQNVHPDDREKMRSVVRLDTLSARLMDEPVFMFHYRVFRNQEIHYYYMKCVGVGAPGNLVSIVFAFACEDRQVTRKQLLAALSPGGYPRRRRILLVNPSTNERRMIRDTLQSTYELLEADCIVDGLELLRDHYRNLSVILLDMFAPGKTGFEFLRQVQQNPFYSAIPVVVTSELMKAEDEERCLNYNVADLMQKPLRASIVRYRIENVIRVQETGMMLDEIEIDETTGLYTRSAFLHHARTIIDANPGVDYSIYVLDVENFKLLNSIHGEECCDGVLRYLAQSMMDFSPNGICARYLGDYLVCLDESGSFAEQSVIEEYIQQMQRRSPIGSIDVNIGIYSSVDPSLRITQMADRAIIALRSITHNFNQRLAFYNGPVSQRFYRSQLYETQFREAIEQKQFHVWYQPKYDPYTDEMISAEALVRWKKPDGTIIPPFEFIPVFEEDGLIGELDEYVFRRVCKMQQKWMAAGKCIPISVNLSRNSVHQQNMPERYESIARGYGIPIEMVPLEITESAMTDNTNIKALIEVLSRLGFRLHMDDFGSGRSSLSALNTLHFDAIKLDKSLIDYIGDKHGDLVLMHTMALARDLGVRIVAEGVENAQQLEFLKQNSCDVVQGYYYSRPLPEGDFEKLLY